ncbi:MAG TPA: ABC transporter ATP-binding protein [Rhodospirillaceae bacterium]|nr:ABC transporter ATP-binding protein [Rhodospirillaceae bacterium]MBL25314.1 ABC transporter ATP-binding protein [Rhodospirillaceae bacterium]HAT35718.1 ABC transporter ATP-binding protein [Rhodospirillaceae bacterium]
MIEVEGLSKSFGETLAVDDISFTLKKGEVLGFLGPNGAGKSTTMKMIAGFLPPTDGTARINGFDVRENPIEVKRSIGYLPEGAPMWSDMNVAGFLKFIAEVRGFKGAEAMDRIDVAVSLTQLEDVLMQPIETLSKGFKRRVGLAQAMLHDPEILILDEPTDGLDPNQKHQVRDLIQKMAGDKAIIISTHILEEVEAVCTRAIIIAKGKLLADATPHELLRKSQHYNSVSVSVPNVEKAKEVLEGLDSVKRVRVTDEEWLLAYPKGKEPINEEVAQALRSARLKVNEIRAEGGRLDDVFRDITLKS